MDAVAWRRGRLSIVLLAVAAIAVGACTSSGAGGSSAPEASEPPAASEPAMSEAPSVAPSEAAASPIAGGLLALAERPDQFRRLREDLDLSPTAIDEMVRWTAP